MARHAEIAAVCHGIFNRPAKAPEASHEDAILLCCFIATKWRRHYCYGAIEISIDAIIFSYDDTRRPYRIERVDAFAYWRYLPCADAINGSDGHDVANAVAMATGDADGF